MQSARVIRAAIESDQTATSEEREAVLSVLNGSCKKPKSETLSTREAADLLGVHVITLRRWGKAGMLTPIRYTPRKIRWPKDMIETFQKTGATV